MEIVLTFPNGDIKISLDILKLFSTLYDAYVNTGSDNSTPLPVDRISADLFAAFIPYFNMVFEKKENNAAHDICIDVTRHVSLTTTEKEICDRIFMVGGKFDPNKFSMVVGFSDYAGFDIFTKMLEKYIAAVHIKGKTPNEIMQIFNSDKEKMLTNKERHAEIAELVGDTPENILKLLQEYFSEN